MLGCCCLIYMFAVLINKVSLEITVRQVVGESAVLPCSYTGDKNKVQTVNWVYNDKDNVFQFSPGSFLQEVKYNVRAESFPNEYDQKNYSIQIRKLEKTDAGEYTCIITPADHYQNIHLIVESKGAPTIVDEKHRTQIGPGIIAFIVVSIICCAGFLIFLIFLKQKKVWICK